MFIPHELFRHDKDLSAMVVEEVSMPYSYSYVKLFILSTLSTMVLLFQMKRTERKKEINCLFKKLIVECHLFQKDIKLICG